MKKSFVLFSVFFIGFFLALCSCSNNANSGQKEQPGELNSDSDSFGSVTDNDTVSDSTDDKDSSDSSSESDKDAETDDSDTDSVLQNDDDTEFCDTKCETLITETGCVAAMDSEYPNYCNGMDDDCDGIIDEGCPCNSGDTQPCFSGKPAQRNVGTCADGVQTCRVVLRAGIAEGQWGECKNEILPKDDICDNADNNCNGCADEGLCCEPFIDCAYDIGTAQPFVDKVIDGKELYDTGHKFNDADKVIWKWTLTKGPCDVVLGKTSFSLSSAVEGVAGASTDAAESITFSGVGLSKFKVNFQLSGTYNLRLKVTRENGESYECEWPLKVVSTGLRVELCWDTHSDIDVDLHLGKNGTTEIWECLGDSSDNAACACYFSGCKYDSWMRPDWGYDETYNYDKDGNGPQLMKNPRLDIDNTGKGAIPENINIDNPKDGDTFRVLVRHFSNAKKECLEYTTTWGVTQCTKEGDYIKTHPVVNIYCGGALKATYGVDPQLNDFQNKDDSWKVTEIRWVGDINNDGCEITPNLSATQAVTPAYNEW